MRKLLLILSGAAPAVLVVCDHYDENLIIMRCIITL